jgi:hypothetical protein
MAIPALAAAAARAAVQYGPAAYDMAKTALAKATNGKVTDPRQVTTYVGNSPQKMQVVADALIRSGTNPNDIFPQDIVQTQPALQAMRDGALRLAANLKQQFDAGSDRVLPGQTANDAAADIIRLQRVQAVLRVYGDEKTYFLCHPNGGVPASDFAYAKAVQRTLYRTR